MITAIIKSFRDQAQEHKAIRAFYYGRNFEKGSGKDIYPLFWLEDPLYGHNGNNIFINTVNFSILFLTAAGKTAAELQNLSFSTGLNIIERIKAQKGLIGIQPGWTFTSLRDYYDDSAAGCRFSVNISIRNMQDLCLIDEQFETPGKFADMAKQENSGILPDGNNKVYTSGLPVFDLKTRKK